MEQRERAREVRIERWSGRNFYVVPCPFRVDIPLDMSGCVVGALRDTSTSGHRRIAGGMILASDALHRGAIYVEVEPMRYEDPMITTMSAEVLARALPPQPAGLRGEVDE